MSIKDTIPMTQEQLDAQMRMRREPLDLDELVRAGLLRKVGAWWAVSDVRSLPEYVRAQVREISVRNGTSLIKLRAARKP